MKGPQTRFDEADSDFERDLLRSWEAERPSTDGRRRTLASIGGAGVAGALSTTTSAGAASGAAGSAAKVGVLGVLALARWLALGVVVTGVASAVVVGALDRSPSPPPPSVPTAHTATTFAPAMPPSTASAQSAEPALPPQPAPLDPPSPSPVVAPPASTTPRMPPAVTTSPAAEPLAAPPPSTAAPAPSARSLGLGEQVALLEAARKSLARGDASTALQLVDDYEARFPGGSLSQEATALEIEALLRLGRRKEAAELAHRFLAAQPKSPYAAKVRRLVDEGETTPSSIP